MKKLILILFAILFLNSVSALTWYSPESNQNVNGSIYWNNMNSTNSTQIENNNGILNIMTSWLFNLFYTKEEINNTIGIEGNRIGFNSTYNETYSNLLNAHCPVGYVVNGTLSNGTLICTSVSGMDYTNVMMQNDSSNKTGNITFDGGAINNAKRIGAGTANPLFPLHVVGLSYLNGQLTATGAIYLGTPAVTIDAFLGGNFIKLSSAGPSGIGVDSNNPWIAYVKSNGNWFTDSLIEDVAYRNTKSRLLFGTSSGNADVIISNGTKLIVNGDMNATENITAKLFKGRFNFTAVKGLIFNGNLLEGNETFWNNTIDQKTRNIFNQDLNKTDNVNFKTVNVTVNYTGGYMVGDNAGGIYMDRGDPASADLAHTGMTIDNTWRDFNLSSIIPFGAKAVNVRVALTDNSANSYLQVRKNGNTNAVSSVTAQIQVANMGNNNNGIISVDKDRLIEYRAYDGGGAGSFTDAGITIIGWFM